jgi:cytochrome P450
VTGSGPGPPTWWTAKTVQRAARRAYLENFVAGIQVSNVPADSQPSLTHALLRGQQFDHDELVSMLMLLLIAGHETTVNLIANAMAAWPALFAHPDQLDLLRAQPTLIAQAIEELLRFKSPVVNALPRVATTDIQVADTTIPTGSVVSIALGAANKDESHTPNPNTLNITRKDTQHLALQGQILSRPATMPEGSTTWHDRDLRASTTRKLI